jgi:hypothetical protein
MPLLYCERCNKNTAVPSTGDVCPRCQATVLTIPNLGDVEIERREREQTFLCRTCSRFTFFVTIKDAIVMNNKKAQYLIKQEPNKKKAGKIKEHATQVISQIEGSARGARYVCSECFTPIEQAREREAHPGWKDPDPVQVVEKIIVKEIVKVRCKHCGMLVENTSPSCPNCAATM